MADCRQYGSKARAILRKWIAPVALSGLAGVLAIVVPVWLIPMEQYDSVLFPTIRTGIEGLGGEAIFLLGALGMILGAIFRHPALTGMGMVLPFPLAGLAEMVVDPSSHNLWPFEFLVYFILSAVPITGGYLGSLLRHLWDSPSG